MVLRPFILSGAQLAQHVYAKPRRCACGAAKITGRLDLNHDRSLMPMRMRLTVATTSRVRDLYVLFLSSRQRIVNPERIINITPGNNLSKGSSSKTIQPKPNAVKIPK